MRSHQVWILTFLLFGHSAMAATTITGTVFDDANRNGYQDGAEAGIDGVTVYIDANMNGSFDSGTETFTTTAGGGLYSLADPGAGDYRIGVVPPNGRSVTYPRYPLKKVSKFRSGTDDYGDVWGDGDMAVLGTYSSGGEVQIVDISDPANPSLWGSWEEESVGRAAARHEGGGTGSQYEDVVFANDVGYFASNTGLGVHIVDLSDPSNPETLEHIDANNGGANNIHNVWLDGDYLYFVTNKTLIVYVFDVSDPSNPVKVREILANAPSAAVRIHECTVKDGKLYLAINESMAEEQTFGQEILETEVWDVSDVENSVTFLGSYNSGYSTHTVWPADDGRHIISAREPYPWEGAEGDISIWDANNLSSPVEVARLRADDMGFGDVTAHIPFTVGNLMYVSWYWAGVKVFDISDPANPALVGGYDTTVRTGDYQGCWGVYPFLGPDKILASDIENGLFILARGLPGGHYIEKEDGADSEYNHFGLSLNQPPSIDSGPTATPLTPRINQSVFFSVTASDNDDTSLTIEWDFGDGMEGAGATAFHAYTTAGQKTVTVTVTDPLGESVSDNSLVVDVQAVTPTDWDGDNETNDSDKDDDGDGLKDSKDPDRDGDGVANNLDPDPDDPSDLGGAFALAGHLGMAVQKLNAKLQFLKADKDNVKAKGVMLVPDGLDLNGATVEINIAGLTKTFTLDGKGQGVSGNDKFKGKLKATKPASNQQIFAWSLSCRKKTYNLEDTDTAPFDDSSPGTETRNVRMTVSIDDGNTISQDWQGVFSVSYSSSEKTGKLKSLKP